MLSLSNFLAGMMHTNTEINPINKISPKAMNNDAPYDIGKSVLLTIFPDTPKNPTIKAINVELKAI